jgi:hypothetical protein
MVWLAVKAIELLCEYRGGVTVGLEIPLQTVDGSTVGQDTSQMLYPRLGKAIYNCVFCLTR